MSGLWDYEDDDDDLQDAGTFQEPSPVVVVEEPVTHKRKPGRKAKAAPARSKRRAASPGASDLSLKPAAGPQPILLLTSDDEDDLGMLPAVADTGRGGSAGTSAPETGAAAAAAGPSKSSARGASTKSAVDNLDPATRKALEEEQKLLRDLRQVTTQTVTIDDDADEPELQPMPSISLLPPLGFPRLSSRLPSASLPGNIGAAAAADGHGGDGAGPSYTGRAGSHDLSVSEADGGAAAGGAAETSAPAAMEPTVTEDRVRLKLLWHGGKDGHLTMRVVKTDPLSKMMHKFREIAAERGLCKDPNKIKFIFDGDDLGKTPNTTPEELELEDDMMIDIKL